jgi:hypothetical protein
MSKKDFIALADFIKEQNRIGLAPYSQEQIEAMANYLNTKYPNFMAGRWKEYIAGNCGKNGGKV